MSPSKNSGTAEDRAMAEAAQWFVRLESEECSIADRERWEHWLAQDPEHRQAWQRVESITADFRLAATEPGRKALDAAGTSRRKALKTLLGIGVLVPGAWLLGQAEQASDRKNLLQSAVGEIKQLDLPDGSRLWLDTASAVSLQYDQVERNISLLEGSIHIHTTTDARPLAVMAGDIRVKPIGTRFSVSRHGQETTVAVEEGAVEVFTAGAQPVVLAVGKKVRIEGHNVQLSGTTEGEFGWTRARLLADNMPLGQLIQQLDRYYAGRILTTAAVAELRVVGVYPLDRIDQALSALADSLPVKINRITPWFVLISA